MVRVQVLMEEEERERFRQLAQRSGLSLSAWLRRAGLEASARTDTDEALDSKESLREFFAACDARETGTEPEWEEHRQVIERSTRSGGTDS